MEEDILFDYKKYKELYPDVKNLNSFSQVLNHYKIYGKKEKRKYPIIDVKKYNWEKYYDTYLPNIPRKEIDTVKYYLLYGKNHTMEIYN